jgi:putative oxidoreductase
MRRLITSVSEPALNFLARVEWLGPLVVRLFFGYFWAETGWAKLNNLDGATARFVEWGIPHASFNATLSAGTEFVGGLFLMFGFLTRLTSAAMLFNMIVAIALVAIKNVNGFDDFIELDEFTYILIFFWFILAGPGRVSVDTLINRWLGIERPLTI